MCELDYNSILIIKYHIYYEKSLSQSHLFVHRRRKKKKKKKKRRRKKKKKKENPLT